MNNFQEFIKENSLLLNNISKERETFKEDILLDVYYDIYEYLCLRRDIGIFFEVNSHSFHIVSPNTATKGDGVKTYWQDEELWAGYYPKKGGEFINEPLKKFIIQNKYDAERIEKCYKHMREKIEELMEGIKERHKKKLERISKCL